MDYGKPTGHHTSRPWPHDGGCAACHDDRVCNVCGVRRERTDGAWCTNGRCGSCHRACCTPGGETSPGHGYGTMPEARRQFALRRRRRLAADRQRERDGIRRDLGMVKVRGALGGTYWE